MRILIGLSVFIGGFFLLSVGFTIIRIVVHLFRKEPINEELKSLNPYYLYSHVNKGEKNTNPFIAALLTLVTIFGILYITIPYTPLGTEEIGSLFEKKKYTTYQYVSLYPEDSESKNYKVVAEIDAWDKDYTINKAYFPNGGFIIFDDFIFMLPTDSLKFGEKVRIEDDDGKKWEIELLHDKPSFKEIEVLNMN